MNSLNSWVELIVETLPLPSLCVPELSEGNCVLTAVGSCLLLGLREGSEGCLCQAAREEGWCRHGDQGSDMASVRAP